MLQNTRSFEKNSFIRFLRFSQIRPLSASAYEQAKTAYERYINYIQLCSDPEILSGIYALYVGKGENTSDRYPVRIRESSFGNEIVTSVRHCIDKIRNENGLVESKPSCGHGLRKENHNPEVSDLFGGAIYPHDLMEIAASMQGLGVGRCLDGSQAFWDMFVESIAWMLNVRINKS